MQQLALHYSEGSDYLRFAHYANRETKFCDWQLKKRAFTHRIALKGSANLLTKIGGV
jgi:hypothetical protein